MRHLPLASVVLVFALVLALLLRSLGTPGGTPAPAGPLASRREPEVPQHALPRGPESSAPRSAASTQPSQPPAVDRAELRARLEAFAGVDLQQREAFEQALDPLLDPALVRAALAALVSGELKEHPGVLSPGEIGALRLVTFATALYSSEGGARDLRERGFSIDGPAFTEEVLRALALIEEPAASSLAQSLSGLAIEDRRVVGKEHVPLLRELVTLYPGREDVYAILLADLGDEEPLEFDLQFLTGNEDPKVLKSHLVAAFEKADRAQALQLMDLVEDLYEGGGEELRAELAQAVAAAAPVALAASFLAERAGPGMLGQFDTLGLRPGGLDALARGYNDLLAVGADAGARRMIVSGLAGGGSETLIGVARMDPDAAVRGQAVVTATWAPDFAPTGEFLGTLRQLSSLGDEGLPAYATVSAASNLLARAKSAGDAALAAETVDFLRGLALDPKVPAYDRAKIPAALEQHLSPAEQQELAQLVAELDGQ